MTQDLSRSICRHIALLRPPSSCVVNAMGKQKDWCLCGPKVARFSNSWRVFVTFHKQMYLSLRISLLRKYRQIFNDTYSLNWGKTDENVDDLPMYIVCTTKSTCDLIDYNVCQPSRHQWENICNSVMVQSENNGMMLGRVGRNRCRPLTPRVAQPTTCVHFNVYKYNS